MFKMKVVKLPKRELGYKLLAKKYDVKSHRHIINWVKNVEKYGIE